MKKYLYISLVALAGAALSFQVVVKPLLNDNIYQQISVDESRMARMPVEALITHLINDNDHLIGILFSDNKSAQEFQTVVKQYQNSEASIERRIISYRITKVASQGKKNARKPYDILLELSVSSEPRNNVTIECRTTFDEVGKRYLIDQILWQETPPSSKLTSGRIEIPKISESTCQLPENQDFSLIRLKHRVDNSSDATPNEVLSGIDQQYRQQVPPDFYQTNAIKQISFPVIEEDKHSYDPGLVISAKDSKANYLGPLFAKLWDGDGTLSYTNERGQELSYPTAFFVDRTSRRLIVMSRNNDYVTYGNAYNHYQFSEPTAVCVIGNYVYVLDGGKNNEIAIFKISLGDKIRLELVSTTDFGMDMQAAGDIAGFATDNSNYLFVSSLRHGRIYRIPLDPATGQAQTGAVVQTYETYSDQNGQSKEFGYINRMEVHPIGGSGRCVLFGLQLNSRAYAFYVDGQSTESKVRLNYQWQFPSTSILTNVGYNLGNNSFNITDSHAGKVHLFSTQGAYLGSGGSFGKEEGNAQLFYPNIISSNGFANDAIEMLVANKWGEDTGFKRLLPQGDIGRIEVIEKAPRKRDKISDHSLIFRYALTSGYQVDYIELKLNGRPIKRITNGLYPNIHSEELLVNGAQTNVLEGLLTSGWNHYEVVLVGRIPGPSNASLQYTRTKELEFYYTPSLLTDNMLAGKGGLSHSVAEPLVLYKSTFVDSDQLHLSGGKIILQEGSVLDISEKTELLIDDEIMEFYCGANLLLRVDKQVSKTIKNSRFDGLNKSFNVLSCYGSYTGGKGSGSAPSSKLSIISSDFVNYLGKALYVKEGRATVVNCSFTAPPADQRPEPFLTAAAIMMAPETRLDVRGSIFSSNDVGIDANGAELYVGHSSRSFKGVKTESPIFKNNQIAIHAHETLSNIQQTIFDGNTAAIIQLSGELDISKNSENLFTNNVQAIIFSDVAKGFQGKNQFIDNNVDLTYILPEEGATEVTYDFSCNYWSHAQSSGTAVIDMFGENGEATVKVTTTPYLTKKGNGFTCTGAKSSKGGRVGIIDDPKQTLSDSTIAHPYHRHLAQLQNDLQKGKNEAYQQLATLSPNKLILNQYLTPEDTSGVYHQALVKNTTLSYLYHAEHRSPNNPENYQKAYQMLGTSHYSADHYVDITKDKLAFLSYFLEEPRTVPSRTEVLPSSGFTSYLRVYPNPVRQQTTVEIIIPEDGHYTITILDSQGSAAGALNGSAFYSSGIHTLPVNLSNFPAGVYYVCLYPQWGNLLDTYRIIKE